MNREIDMEPRLTPTFFQIIATDYFAQNLFVMIFGPWAIYLINFLIEGERVIFLIFIAALCTLVGGVAFPWRYWTITSTFEHGAEIAGVIVDIHTVSTGKKRKDYILDYEYDFGGRTYQYRNRVKKNSFAHDLKNGQKVILLVNPNKPSIAFIRDIYLRDL